MESQQDQEIRILKAELSTCRFICNAAQRVAEVYERAIEIIAVNEQQSEASRTAREAMAKVKELK